MLFNRFHSQVQVFVASIRNRKLPLPKNADELHEIRDKEAAMPYEILEKTDQFRCHIVFNLHRKKKKNKSFGIQLVDK